MMIQLQTYDTEIIYPKGKKIHLANALFRAYLPLKDSINNTRQAIFDKINIYSYLSIPDERLRQIRESNRRRRTTGTTQTCDPHRFARFQRSFSCTSHTLFSFQR